MRSLLVGPDMGRGKWDTVTPPTATNACDLNVLGPLEESKHVHTYHKRGDIHGDRERGQTKRGAWICSMESQTPMTGIWPKLIYDSSSGSMPETKYPVLLKARHYWHFGLQTHPRQNFNFTQKDKLTWREPTHLKEFFPTARENNANVCFWTKLSYKRSPTWSGKKQFQWKFFVKWVHLIHSDYIALRLSKYEKSRHYI